MAPPPARYPPRRCHDRPRGRTSPAMAPYKPRRAHGSARRKAALKSPHKAPRPRLPRVAWCAYARGHARARAHPRARPQSQDITTSGIYVGFVVGLYNVGCTCHYVITPRGKARRPKAPRTRPGGQKPGGGRGGTATPPSHAGPNPQKQPSKRPLLGGRRDDARGGVCPPSRA